MHRPQPYRATTGLPMQTPRHLMIPPPSNRSQTCAGTLRTLRPNHKTIALSPFAVCTQRAKLSLRRIPTSHSNFSRLSLPASSPRLPMPTLARNSIAAPTTASAFLQASLSKMPRSNLSLPSTLPQAFPIKANDFSDKWPFDRSSGVPQKRVSPPSLKVPKPPPTRPGRPPARFHGVLLHGGESWRMEGILPKPLPDRGDLPGSIFRQNERLLPADHGNFVHQENDCDRWRGPGGQSVASKEVQRHACPARADSD